MRIKNRTQKAVFVHEAVTCGAWVAAAPLTPGGVAVRTSHNNRHVATGSLTYTFSTIKATIIYEAQLKSR